jgi:hypothetical protein
VIEKFQHKSDDTLEIECEECGCTEFERLLPNSHIRKWLNADEMMEEKIKPGSDDLTKKIKKGSDADFLDVYGEK